MQQLNLIEASDAEAGATAVIEFDGGSTCNVPKWGYGNGYGSYRINGGEIKRVQFEPMSANCGEISTLLCALKEASQAGYKNVEIFGDSKIALLRCHRASKQKKFSRTEMFLRLSSELLAICRSSFQNVKTTWHPRSKSVENFGH